MFHLFKFLPLWHDKLCDVDAASKFILDVILLISSSVCELQRIFDICERELVHVAWYGYQYKKGPVVSRLVQEMTTFAQI